jgi:hypothetical protein
MDDLSKIGDEYEAAEVKKYSIKEQIKLFLIFWWFLLRAVIDSIPYMIDFIKSIFVGVKPKNIHGQLALGE